MHGTLKAVGAVCFAIVLLGYLFYVAANDFWFLDAEASMVTSILSTAPLRSWDEAEETLPTWAKEALAQPADAGAENGPLQKLLAIQEDNNTVFIGDALFDGPPALDEEQARRLASFTSKLCAICPAHAEYGAEELGPAILAVDDTRRLEPRLRRLERAVAAALYVGLTSGEQPSRGPVILKAIYQASRLVMGGVGGRSAVATAFVALSIRDRALVGLERALKTARPPKTTLRALRRTLAEVADGPDPLAYLVERERTHFAALLSAAKRGHPLGWFMLRRIAADPQTDLARYTSSLQQALTAQADERVTLLQTAVDAWRGRDDVFILLCAMRADWTNLVRTLDAVARREKGVLLALDTTISAEENGP